MATPDQTLDERLADEDDENYDEECAECGELIDDCVCDEDDDEEDETE